ncbi:hypothetical protein LCGC14_1167790 [marine sediment metagenome]|uniref:Uncharacterized protein n=1 Tax=marine sediment metagenome TaxID=412755 RepID=A0A0F9P8T3_9ZZZZ
MKWFRFYAEALNDPKVQRLPGPLFKFWVNILCLAQEHDGVLPDLKGIAYGTRTRPVRCQASVKALQARGLLDTTPGGLMPHNWSSRQYKSDDVTLRVQRFRAKNETPPEPDTENREQRTDQQALSRSSKQPVSRMPWPDSLFKASNNGEGVRVVRLVAHRSGLRTRRLRRST